MDDRWEFGADAGEQGAGARGAGASPDPAYGEGTGPAGATGPGDAGGQAPFPWPPGESDSVLASFAETWKGATFDPTALFRRVPRDRGTGPALLYYLVLVVLVAGATLFWESLSLIAVFRDSALASDLAMEPVSPLVGFFLTPALLLLTLIVSAGVMHVLLALFDGGREGFGTTVRVTCYAYSPGLFGVVPVIGGLIGTIWMIVLLIIGLREAHGADGWKAAVAVLLPFAILVAMMVFAFIMLAAAGAALFGDLPR